MVKLTRKQLAMLANGMANPVPRHVLAKHVSLSSGSLKGCLDKVKDKSPTQVAHVNIGKGNRMNVKGKSYSRFANK